MASAKAPAKKTASKKKPVSAKQATNVAAFMKSQKSGGNADGGPAQPTPAADPVKTDNDQDDEE